ncbi:MAG TPA: helical backbone metal receptor [Abditibacteriaceae bacterium]
MLPLILISVAGCSAPQTETPQTKASKQTPSSAPLPAAQGLPADDWKRTIALSRTPKRIVVIGPGAVETVFALGLGDRIVGRDSASDFPAAAKKIPVVADYKGPFFESVRAARPDLVVVQGETYDAARLDAWQKKCGAPVAGLAATTVAGVEAGTEKLAAWLGTGKKLPALSATKAAAAITETAFLEVSRRPLMTAGRDTLVGDALAHAGLRNVAEIKGYKTYSLETLLAQNPKYYVVTGDSGKKTQIVKELQNAAGLKNLPSIRAGRVLVVSGDWLLRPGPRLGQGIASLRSMTSEAKANATKASVETANPS